MKRCAKRQLKEQLRLKREFAKTGINPFTGLCISECTWTRQKVLKLLFNRIQKAQAIYDEAKNYVTSR
jgi:hypothetical protein